jgi:hypothetical protein
MKAAALALLAVVVLGGCAQPASRSGAAPGPGAIVDGFPLGTLRDPLPEPDVTALAVKALDERMPGHPAIVSATAYNEDVALIYGPGTARSGSMTIYLYLLADGSYHAAGVYCGVGGCAAWPVYTGGPG